MYRKYKKNIYKVFLSSCSMLLLNGCVQKTIPKNDLAYKKMKTIRQLNGCYANLAESEADYKQYLSVSLIFKNKVKHQKIKSVCLKASDKKRLAIIARDQYRNIIYQNILIEGKDFIFKSDKLNLYNKTHYMGGDANVLGVTSEYRLLGIDRKNNIKMIKGYSGVIILPLPFMMSGSDTYRFNRLLK